MKPVKKIIINERQLVSLINNLKESNPVITNDTEILEEGFKEIVLSGLIALASITGIKAQNGKGINPETLKAAEMVQNKLEQGDTTLLKYFDEAGIEKNNKNLEKLKNADLKKGEFKTITTTQDNLSKKLKGGYTVSGFEITKDTLVSELPGESSFITSFSTMFDSDLFLTSKYDLDNAVKMELAKIIELVNSEDGKISNIRIESSTDTEPIQMGNEKLAQLRANSVYDYLIELGVDAADIEIMLKPEQGPKVFSKNMSDQERAEARTLTKDFRYVTISYDLELTFTSDKPSEKVYEVIEKVKFQMVRPISKTKGDKIKTKYKPEKCKIKKPKIKPGQPVIYKCP